MLTKHVYHRSSVDDAVDYDVLINECELSDENCEISAPQLEHDIEAINDKTDKDNEFIIKFVDKIDDYVVYDSSNHKMQKFAQKFNEYEFKGKLSRLFNRF